MRGGYWVGSWSGGRSDGSCELWGVTVVDKFDETLFLFETENEGKGDNSRANKNKSEI